jgi:hypothetical protein
MEPKQMSKLANSVVALNVTLHTLIHTLEQVHEELAWMNNHGPTYGIAEPADEQRDEVMAPF